MKVVDKKSEDVTIDVLIPADLKLDIIREYFIFCAENDYSIDDLRVFALYEVKLKKIGL